MKNVLRLLFFIISFNLHCQTLNKDSLKTSAIKFQEELNIQYADSVHSPMLREDRLKFKGHDFYTLDLNYCVVAELIKTPEEKVFKMMTSGVKRPEYVKYGEMHFKLNGKKHKLSVYQNVDLVKKEEYKDDLFLPFKDLTSGNETYGGGRFMDLKIPSGSKIIIDFNRAYNPYCAYNHKYSCPVPPPENLLETEINAGIKFSEP
jgi:uncharacterized protein (DUF1684 family)